MMDTLIKDDIIDLLKVLPLSSFSYALASTENIVAASEVVTAVGKSLIVVLTVAYTVFKLIDMYRHMRWKKEEREQKE